MSPMQWKVYHAFREAFLKEDVRIATEERPDFILVVAYSKSYSYFPRRTSAYTPLEWICPWGPRRIDVSRVVNVPHRELQHLIEKDLIIGAPYWMYEEIAKEAKCEWDSVVYK